MLPLIATAAALLLFALALVAMARHFRKVERQGYVAFRAAQSARDARKRAACTAPVPALPGR